MMAGGRLIGTETVIIAGCCDNGPQQTLVSINRSNDRGTENEKLSVVVRCLAGIEQVALRTASQGPVHMLARTVHTSKRLLMQQASHPMLFCDTAQCQHHQLLMIGGKVRGLKHGCDFKLTRRNLIVTRFHRNPELEQLALGFQHESQYTLRNCTK